MTIRRAIPSDAAAIARVHVESWRATYSGILPEEFLVQLSAEPRERYWRHTMEDPASRVFVCVAEDEAGQVVGFAAGGPERSGDPLYPGELYAIYLLQPHQRRGIGRRLTSAVAQTLAQAGMESMLVWVLAENPARRFYEALGGRRLRSQVVEIGGVRLEEVAYGWKDVGVLGDRS